MCVRKWRLVQTAMEILLQGYFGFRTKVQRKRNVIKIVSVLAILLPTANNRTYSYYVLLQEYSQRQPELAFTEKYFNCHYPILPNFYICN